MATYAITRQQYEFRNDGINKNPYTWIPVICSGHLTHFRYDIIGMAAQFYDMRAAPNQIEFTFDSVYRIYR